MPEFPCGVCSKNVNTNHHAICCDICDQWVHIHCNLLDDKDYNKLKNNPESDFNCITCVKIYYNLIICLSLIIILLCKGVLCYPSWYLTAHWRHIDCTLTAHWRHMPSTYGTSIVLMCRQLMACAVNMPSMVRHGNFSAHVQSIDGTFRQVDGTCRQADGTCRPLTAHAVNWRHMPSIDGTHHIYEFAHFFHAVNWRHMSSGWRHMPSTDCTCRQADGTCYIRKLHLSL